MRAARTTWTTAVIGVPTALAASLTFSLPPVGADTPDHRPTTEFVVDNAADLADANPGDGRCAIAADSKDKKADGQPGKSNTTIPKLHPPIAPPIDDGSAGRCTLRAAVDESNANPDRHHTVTLPSDLGVYRLTAGELVVSGQLTVTRDFSPGSKRAAINAGHRSRIFVVVDGASLTADGLFLAQGSAAGGSGGAVHIRRATVAINRSVVVHGRAGYGGAVSVGFGAHLDARHTSFESNQATRGGAIHAVGSVNLDRASLFDNKAERGGGIYLQTRSDEGFWTEHTSIIDNTATDAGGAVYFGGQGYAGMVHATVSANAADQGGGIYVHPISPQFVLAYSVIAGNRDTGNPTAADASPDCHGEMSTSQGNLFGAISGQCWGYDVSEDTIGTVRNPIDPGLEFVRISADANDRGDGGELAYRRPAFNSPALDAIPIGRCFNDDDMLRENARFGVPCDLGAVER